MVSNRATSASTMVSSIRVKPRVVFIAGALSPLPVRDAIAADPAGRRCNVEDIRARLRIVRRAGIAARDPLLRWRDGGVERERIERDVAQKNQPRRTAGAGLRVLHPIYQRIQRGWV